MDVIPDEHVKIVSGYTFLALHITLAIILNLNEVCHGENYVLKLLNNEDDDEM